MNMYIAKVYLNRTLLTVKLYENYEHFISDLTDENSELYEELPEDFKFDASKPRIMSACADELAFNTDFEYVYPDGLLVYCGEAVTQEACMRGILKNH